MFAATKTALAQGLIYLDGKPLSLKDYPFHSAIYDGEFPRLLLKLGRQIGKSTMAAHFIILESITKAHFRTLYVAPVQEQTSKFSNTRLSKTLHYSPLIRKRFCGIGSTDNVLSKLLTNGSEIALSYAQDDPDRIRGVSADRVILDEVQDMDLYSVRPIVMECAANSDYGYEFYLGTPKSMENGIEWMWQQSTQTEWIMKCPGCSSWNFVDTPKSIGLKGPICLKCGHLLNPRDGQWYDFKPDARVKGFHLSQVILPRNVELPQRWDRIMDKLENYAPQKFKNEVLGVSDAIGTRMISKQELEELCDESNVFQENGGPLNYPTIAGGVDWSGGGQSTAGQEIQSRTVAWVWAVLPDNRLKCLYYKVFPGRNQVEDVREVANIFQKFRVQLVCGDAGEGAVANAMLKEILGEHRVFQLQYGSTAKQIIWNGKDRFMIDRTSFIDSYMLMLKRKGVVFGPLRVMQQAIGDILAEYEEVTQNGQGKKVWRHAPTQPDDCLHAAVFAWTALRLARGELQLYRNDLKPGK
jgi:hypothetical protein